MIELQIPTDLGVLWTKNLYVEENQMPTQMEMFFKLKTGPSGLRGNYATYESAGKSIGEKREELQRRQTDFFHSEYVQFMA